MNKNKTARLLGAVGALALLLTAGAVSVRGAALACHREE